MATAAILNVFCTICSEQYCTGEQITSTACGHVYHENCLLNWRQRSVGDFHCPECRKPNPSFARIFLNVSTEENNQDPETLTQEENLIKRISLLERKLESNENNFMKATMALTAAEKVQEDLKYQMELYTACIKSYEQKIQELELNLQESEANLLNSLNELSKTEQILKEKMKTDAVVAPVQRLSATSPVFMLDERLSATSPVCMLDERLSATSPVFMLDERLSAPSPVFILDE